MISRQWLGDVGLAVLLVLPTAGIMWPARFATASQSERSVHPATALPSAHSAIEQRFGLRR